MRLAVFLPTHVAVDEAVDKVVAEAEDGWFCLLPRHVDMAAALVPGILSYRTVAGATFVLGIDEGMLVKCAAEVLISTLDAVPGDDLGTLRDTVRRRFVDLDEHERVARSALARLEAGIVRRFVQMGERAP